MRGLEDDDRPHILKECFSNVARSSLMKKLKTSNQLFLLTFSKTVDHLVDYVNRCAVIQSSFQDGGDRCNKGPVLKIIVRAGKDIKICGLF